MSIFKPYYSWFKIMYIFKRKNMDPKAGNFVINFQCFLCERFKLAIEKTKIKGNKNKGNKKC